MTDKEKTLLGLNLSLDELTKEVIRIEVQRDAICEAIRFIEESNNEGVI